MNATKLRVVYSTLYSLFLSNEPQRVVCSFPPKAWSKGVGQRKYSRQQMEIEKKEFFSNGRAFNFVFDQSYQKHFSTDILDGR